MVFCVTEEQLDAIRDEALDTLRATRSHAITDERYDWLYRQNPDGAAVLWSIRDADSGTLAGFTAALPRRMLVDGHPCVAWIGADFSIRPKFRSLGAAIKLRRAAREAIDAGRADFLYSHPNDRMQVIHEKVGHRPVGAMVRYARPIRTGEFLRRRFGDTWLSSTAERLADGVVGLKVRQRVRRTGHTHVVLSPEFDGRFDSLFQRSQTERRVLGVRDGRYLNWRYAQNPLYRTHAIVAGDDERLDGYLLFTVRDNVAHVKDVFTTGNGSAAHDVLAALLKYSWESELSSVSATVLEGHPMAETLSSLGFFLRPDTSRMFGYAPSGSRFADVIHKAACWWGTAGDRDV